MALKKPIQQSAKGGRDGDPPKNTSWYHLNLFQKFALIFFGVVALSVVVIAVYALQQSQLSISESTEQILDAVTLSIGTLNEKQQHESENTLDRVNQGFLELSNDSLLQFKARLLQDNQQLYARSVEELTREAQELLETEFQSLNIETARSISSTISQFVDGSQAFLAFFAMNCDITEAYNRRVDTLRKLLLLDERFIHVSVFNREGRRIGSLTQEEETAADFELFFAHDDQGFLTPALKDGAPSVDLILYRKMNWLRVVVPISQDDEVQGALVGVVNLTPLWGVIRQQFTSHARQMYVLDQEGSILFPAQTPSMSLQASLGLQAVARAVETTGNAQQEKLLSSYVTIPELAWRVVITQPTASLATRFAPISRLISQDIETVTERLETGVQEAMSIVSEELSAKITANKEEARQRIEADYQTFITTTRDEIAQKITQISTHIYKDALKKVIPIIALLGIMAAVLGTLVAGAIIRPIKRLTSVAQTVSQGNVSETVPVIHSHDEIGILARSFHETTVYLQKIAKSAQKIAEGEFTDDVSPVSDHDSLGNAFEKMTVYLREITMLATAIAHGDLDQVVTPKSELDALGNAVYRMTVYLQDIASVTQKVAGGDLSEQVQPHSEKDFLGNALAEMIFKLRHLVAKIRTGADQLVFMSMETHSRAQEEAESVEKISLSVEETSSSMNEMAATIGEVNERMKQLSSFVGESSSSIEELNSSIRQISTHGEQLAMASEQTSSSIQEISASLQQIADTAKHSKMLSDGARQDAIDGRESVGKMIHSMNIIQQMVTVTADAIQLLKKRTGSIEKILAVIKDISDQTSLLSINASIIAKKTGERGREFNVIADKVRKLADQSNSSAKEIARIIRDVQKESSHAVEVVSMGSKKVQEGVQLAELAGKALDKIIGGANESSSVVARIAETTDEQTKISQHIMNSMEQVVEMVNQIKVATKEQEQSSSYIMAQIEQILLLSQQVKQSTTDQTGVVKHVSFAMDDIRNLIEMTSERAKESTQAASILSQHADALKRLVSQFTI